MARAQKLRVRALPMIASSLAPRFFMARATEPMFPDPRGRTRTMRMLVNISQRQEKSQIGAMEYWSNVQPSSTPMLQSSHPAFAYLANGHDLFFKRSEEHTSELQSQSNLVCRLLL